MLFLCALDVEDHFKGDSGASRFRFASGDGGDPKHDLPQVVKNERLVSYRCLHKGVGSGRKTVDDGDPDF